MDIPVDNELMLRTIRLEDGPDLAALIRSNAEHLNEFLPKVARIDDVGVATLHLRQCLDLIASGELMEFHLWNEGGLCGAIRVANIDTENKKASLGCYLGREFQGRGIMRRSLRRLIEVLRESGSFNRLEMRCAVGNGASVGLAVALGFTLEGTLRQAEKLNGAFHDHFVFSLIADDDWIGADEAGATSANEETNRVWGLSCS